ncbi:MAG: ECF transporter S component [Bacilli bacterium]|nr:ECF transporter S component [Bacilli bacterium]
MSKFDLTRLVITIACIVIAGVFVLAKAVKKKNPITTKFIARTGLFAAMSIILYVVPGLTFGVPFFPAFLEFHFDEVPALIAGFAYGPLSGFFVILVKTLVKLPFTSTMGVGELADFIYSTAFIIPAALFYKKNRSVKGALIGLLVATVVQVLTSSLITSFLILDFYIFMMGFPKAAILGMCQAANPRITSLGWTFWLYVGVPFNAMKDAMVVVITFILYKRLHKIIDRIGEQH